MSIPFVFTDHAIRQFRRRHAPEWTYAQCENELAAGCRDGVATGRQGYRGSKVYRFTTLGIEAMVDFDERERVNVVVTVLPVRHGRQIDPREVYEAEERLRASAAREHELAAEVAAAPRPPAIIPKGTTPDGNREYMAMAARRDAAKAELQRQTMISAIIRDELKTMRAEISYDTDKEHARRALRLALHALDPVARQEVRVAIAAFDDGLASDEFIGIARADRTEPMPRPKPIAQRPLATIGDVIDAKRSE